jgi:elongation factor P
MIATTDFRRGMTKILYKEEPWLVADFSHVKPGKGGAFVRTKLKNLLTGLILEATFRSEEKFADPGMEKKTVQFLYADSLVHFLDHNTFEQISLSKAQVDSAANYLKENENYEIDFFNDKPVGVKPPTFMVLEVKETVPGVKGNTAHGGSKPAVLETGLKINVPLFVDEGDKIKVDTRTDEYIERV